MEISKRLSSYARKNNFIKLILIISAMCGCLHQTIEMSIQYFSYRTSNRITQDLLAEGMYMSSPISICFGAADIIDWESLSKSGPGLQNIYDGKFQSKNNFLNLTVEQMFHFSPDVKDVFTDCAVRDEFNTRTWFHGSECYDVFHVLKYFTQDLMCYIFRLKHLSQVRGEFLTNSLHDPFKDYDIIFSPKFENVSFVTPIIFDRNSSHPFLARSTARYHRLYAKADHKNKLSSYFFSEPTWIKSILLPKPYETGCVYRTTDDLYGCRANCSIAKAMRLNRVPHYDMLMEPYPFKPINWDDMRNVTFRAAYDEMIKECIGMCSFIPCHGTYTVTAFRAVKDDAIVLGVTVLTPTTLYMANTAIPLMSFIEYFSFVSGTIGTWFGLSFMSLEFMIGKFGCRCRNTRKVRSSSGSQRMTYLTSTYTTRRFRQVHGIAQ